MRNDEVYNPEPQSMQIGLRGMGGDGESDAIDARKWIDKNPSAWAYMIDNAIRLSHSGYVSANYLVNMVRNELHVSVPNILAPAFARIMEATVPSLKDAFCKHRSRSDGYAGVDTKPQTTNEVK